MGRQSKIKEVVRRWRKGELTVDFPTLLVLDLLRLSERTFQRALARSAGMKTKYTEQHQGKTWGGLSRGYRRALDRAEKNSPKAVERVKKTYPGVRVSSGLTRTCYYE